MHITVSCAGRLKEAYWTAAAREFEKRLSAFCKLKIREVPESAVPALPAQKAYVAALCAEGDMLSSVQLAEKLAYWQNTGVSSLCFLIGGSDGLPADMKAQADLRLSFGPMTWTHAMARVMLLEQLYRGFTILSGMKYHK